MSTLRTIGRGKIYVGLYIFEPIVRPNAAQPSGFISAATFQDSTVLWHARLGHLSHSRLIALKTVLPLDASSIDHAKACGIFPLTKQ